MNQKIKQIIRPPYVLLRLLWRLNICKTIYINFKALRFSEAIKFPVFIFGKLKIQSITGKILINSSIKTGLIQIGKDLDGFPDSELPVKLTLNGMLIFNGPAIISGGTNLTVWGGFINIGKYCTIGSGTVIKSTTGIKIGDFTRIVMNCVLMDTNVHYIKNIETGQISKSFGEIIIGKNCWINTGTYIGKDTEIPDFCVVAQNSRLNTDYTKLYPTNSFLAGSPAKLKANNVQRIFDYNEEQKLNAFFKKNKDQNFFMAERGLFIDDEQSVINFFKPL